MTVQLLTVKQAAAALAVHEDTIRRRIEAGELPVVRIGRLVRVDEAELTRLVNRGRPRQPDAKREVISPRQQAALHARAGEIDRSLKQTRGTAKAQALAAASEHFGRTITSAASDGEDPGALGYSEASWTLDWLDEQRELARAGR